MDRDGSTTSATDVVHAWGIGEIENSALVRAVYGLISVIGIGGNLLVCLVVLRVPSLRSNTSFFLVHLAIVDLMVCLWVIPFHLLLHVPSSTPGLLGEIICRIYNTKYPLWVSMQASIFNLVVVNLERYVAIVHPHKYKNIYKPRNKYLMLAACWVVASLPNTYIFLLFDVDGTGECLFVGWGNNTASKVVTGSYVMTMFILGPIFTMAITHWRIISTLKKQVRRLTENQQGIVSQEQNPIKQREIWQLHVAQELQKTLAFVMVAYAVCWTPNCIIYLAFCYGAAVNFSAPYYHASIILGVCNSCLNPIIYTMKNQPFRGGIKQLFGCGTAQVIPHEDTSNVVRATTETS